MMLSVCILLRMKPLVSLNTILYTSTSDSMSVSSVLTNKATIFFLLKISSQICERDFFHLQKMKVGILR